MEEKYIDIEFYIYDLLKKYLEENSRFTPKIFLKAPKQLTTFPTIIFKETNRTENTKYKTLDYSQTVHNVTNTIEVYTQDMIIDGVKYASKIVMSEIKYLLFEFFKNIGFTINSCNLVDYYNYEVDRLIMTVSTSQASWNGKVM